MARPTQVAPRPLGLTVLALLLLLYSLGSLRAVVLLFPMWLTSMQQHHYASYPSLWIELISGLSAAATAYGFWYRRRWSRIPFLICAVLGASAFFLIVAFGVSEYGARTNWIALSTVILFFLAFIGLVARYVWQHT